MRELIESGPGRLWMALSLAWLLGGYWHFIGAEPWGPYDVDREIVAEMSRKAVDLALDDFSEGEPPIVTRIRANWDKCLGGYARRYAWRDPLASFTNKRGTTLRDPRAPNETQYRCWGEANSGLQYIHTTEGFREKVWQRRIALHLSAWGQRIALPYLGKVLLPWFAFSLVAFWVYRGFQRKSV